MKRFRTASIVSTAALLVGCASAAWIKYPIKIAPDYSCFYGGPEGGTRYYVWRCLDQKRVVVVQSGFGFWSASADKFESSCDGKTEAETEQVLDPQTKQCQRPGPWETDPKTQK